MKRNIDEEWEGTGILEENEGGIGRGKLKRKVDVRLVVVPEQTLTEVANQQNFALVLCEFIGLGGIKCLNCEARGWKSRPQITNH